MRVYPKFLLSAMAPEHFPPPSAPEIAFLGRSNVGKSSLINALLGSKQAKVSQTPGRTRAINFFAIADSPTRQQPRWIFADLPGYGYAKISKSISSEWPSFIDPYLKHRETLALCVCLVDSNIPPQSSDAQLIEFLTSVGRAFLVVGTKADRLSGNARVKAEKTLREGLGIERMLLCSAEKGRGLNELWSEIAAAAVEETTAKAKAE
jgi:GTP-binding protein